MGSRGPKPKPSAMKHAQGTWRPDRVAAREMSPQPGTPVCPAHLDERARAEWDRVVPLLEECGVLTLVDGAGLEAYCAIYSMAVWYQQLASRAPMLKNAKGEFRPNPAAAEARRHWALARQYLSEFGLTPAARTRVSTPEGSADEGSAEEFLFGPLKAIPGGKA